MKIKDILAQDKVTLSFEVFPPKTNLNYESVEKATTEIAVEFDGDDAKSLTLTSTTEFDSSSKDIMDEYESLLNDTVEEYKNDGYITSLERDGDSIIYYTASKQIEDMSEEERETFGIESSMTTYDTYKNGFEEMVYTCE